MGIWRHAQRLLAAEESWFEAPRQPRGIPTGLAGLDALTRGMRPREVTLLAARTSHGKSALALTIACNALKWELLRAQREKREPRRVLYISPEMHPEQLLCRLAAAESHVDLESIEEGTAAPHRREQWRAVLTSLEVLDPYLTIEGGYGIDIDAVESLVRTQDAERRLLLVVVDYIQRISYGVIDDDYRRLSAVSQALKDLANDIGVPFLVVSQLNRQIERDRHQGDRMPDLSDLRGSGRLEEDADNVWILWRPPRLSQEQSSAPQTAKLIVAKARSGKVGEVELWFYPRIVTFVDPGSGRVRADGGISVHSVAGEPLPSLVELASLLSRRSQEPVPSQGTLATHDASSASLGDAPASDAAEDDPEGSDGDAGDPAGTEGAAVEPEHDPPQEAADAGGEQPPQNHSPFSDGSRFDGVSIFEILDSWIETWKNLGTSLPPAISYLDAAPVSDEGATKSAQAAASSRRQDGSPKARQQLAQAPVSSTREDDSSRASQHQVAEGKTVPWPQQREETRAPEKEVPLLVLFDWFPEEGRKEKKRSSREDGSQQGAGRSPPGRRRGADFEKRLAKRLGASRWPGHDGDIEFQGWRIECKYRYGLSLDSRSELRHWLEQVYEYAKRWEEGKRWALAITGGNGYRRGAVFVLMPLEFWLELVCGTSCSKKTNS